MMTEIRHAKSFKAARVKTLVAVMFCYLFYYTGRQNFGFAIPGMTEEFHLTKAQLGWCSSALLWSYAIGQAINNDLVRRMLTIRGLHNCAPGDLVAAIDFLTENLGAAPFESLQGDSFRLAKIEEAFASSAHGGDSVRWEALHVSRPFRPPLSAHWKPSPMGWAKGFRAVGAGEVF